MAKDDDGRGAVLLSTFYGEACPVISSHTESHSSSAFLSSLETHLILHPEYTSSNIQRADILHDSVAAAQFTSQDAGIPTNPAHQVAGFTAYRTIKRILRPSRPFDKQLHQDCVFYHACEASSDSQLVVFFPDLSTMPLPFYHPQVSLIAFYFGKGSTSILMLPLPNQSLPRPVPPNHKLYRTALRLLQALTSVMNTWGENGNTYKKRVYHDLLVERTVSLDSYVLMKERYTWLLQGNLWRDTIGTDPNKHVWEDVGIACWLINLLDTIPAITFDKRRSRFVDIGCGNGLLVHILETEGYPCIGFDLAARKIWPHYPMPTPQNLHTVILDPPQFISQCLVHSTLPQIGSKPLPRSPFFIGNHADELTPWIPLMTAAVDEVESLSDPYSMEKPIFMIIPCCFHDLTSRFTRLNYKLDAKFFRSFYAGANLVSTEVHPLMKAFVAPTPQMFDILPDGSISSRGGRYAAYQLFLAELCLKAGYVPEREALRIGSTKNLGIVGRQRVWEVTNESEGAGRQRVREEIACILTGSGGWKARDEGGKDH